MMRQAPVLLLAAAGAVRLLGQAGQPETAAEIMARVAENQERAQQMRSAFVYNQSVLVRLNRGNGKPAREEHYEFTVAPTPDGIRKTRTHFLGRYARKGKLHEYYEPHHNYNGLDIDGDLISDLADDLTNDEDSRDGIAADLFPLTGQQQKKYQFQLEGREKYRDREVYRIAFRPSGKSARDWSAPWKGEVLVDVHSFQPVLVATWLAKGVPVWARTLLGTNVKYVGFKVAYEKFENGLWFPVSYGGEFEMRIVFFYKRKISMSLRNSGFERADVTSTVSYGETVQ